MSQAANLTADPTRAAAYLAHGRDELRHLRMFSLRASQLADASGSTAPAWVRSDSSALFQTLGETDFLAFITQGERRAVRRFEHIERALNQLGDTRTANIFKAIQPDEVRHTDYTRTFLEGITTPNQVSQARNRVWRWDLFTQYRRLGRNMAWWITQTGLAVLYLLCAPLALWTRFMRPIRTGFVSS